MRHIHFMAILQFSEGSFETIHNVLCWFVFKVQFSGLACRNVGWLLLMFGEIENKNKMRLPLESTSN